MMSKKEQTPKMESKTSKAAFNVEIVKVDRESVLKSKPLF
jgi:hypothetical protein